MLNIVMRIWLAISNIMWRNKNNFLFFYDYYDGEMLPSLWIKQKAEEMFQKFEYTYDKIENILPPDTAYFQAYNNNKLKDDCDGFASLMYHVLCKNYETLKIENLALFCVIPLELKTLFHSHVVLGVKLSGKWYVVDYNRVYCWDNKTLLETMESYWNNYFRDVIKAETTKHYCTSFQYNYAFRKWELAEIKD